MKSNRRPLKSFATPACALITSLIFVGCGSPPSVVPLLRIANKTMQIEAAHLKEDAQRQSKQIEQARQALQRAFETDLETTEDLSAAWIREATDVYVAAREALVRHEIDIQLQQQQRGGNLQAASQALQQAVELLEQQDQLLRQTIGLDVWRLAR